jgi:predicted ribosomally synthesized peptide with nif11-like leader
MSKDQLRSFLEAVNTDTALQEKLKDADEHDAVAAIAKSAGFESVSPDLITDFLEYVAAQSASEQEGEQELSAVSGGLSPLAIAGIATGAVAGAGVIAGAVWAFSPSKKPFDCLMDDQTNQAKRPRSAPLPLTEPVINYDSIKSLSNFSTM